MMNLFNRLEAGSNTVTRFGTRTKYKTSKHYKTYKETPQRKAVLLGSPNILSLQRRRERYCIIHVWKMLNELAPNGIKLVFYTHGCLGIKIGLPPVNYKAQASVKTEYENSFRIKTSRLWHLLPRSIN